MDRDFEEQMESREHSPELRDTPGSQSTPELFQEAWPRCPSDELEGQGGGRLSSPESLNVSLQPSPVEMATTGSPHPSLELSLVASPQESAEKAQPLSSQFSIKDLYSCMGQPQVAGDLLELKKEQVPCMASGELLASSSEGSPTILSPSGFFQPQQTGGSDSHLSALSYTAGHKMAMARLDPAQLPCHWVCPLAEIVDPDSESHLLETYRGRPQGVKTGAPARRPATGPCVQVSPAPFVPLPPGVPFHALGLRLQHPTLSSRLPLPGFRPKLPLPCPEIRFLYRQPDVARNPSPQMWPGAKWPSGWEGEAELLEDLWAGRIQVPQQVLDSGDPEDQRGEDPYRSQSPESQILEATSQVVWKPMLQSEAMKLAPGVSMWNSPTQMLLSSNTPQQQDNEGGTSPPTE